MLRVHEPDRPLVSALVTAFNHERFIGPAIESLLAQSYSPIEIIVVDDGSNDRTLEIANSYREAGVRVLSGKEEGPSAAMNLAMSQARGDIFLLQSGDDMSEPHRAETQVAMLASADLACCFPRLVDGDGNAVLDETFSVFFRLHSPESMEALFTSLYSGGNFLCASSMAMRRAVWASVGDFHTGLLQLQDYDYWLRAVVSGHKIAIAAERLISYRVHGNNLSTPAHNTRMLRELGTLMRRLASDIPHHMITTILYGRSFEGVEWRPEDRQMLLSLLFIRHEAEQVRQIGFEGLIDIAGNPESAARVKEIFGLSHRDLFGILLHAQ